MVRFRLAGIVTLSIIGSLPTVQASCGSANCSLLIDSQELLAAPGQLIVDLSYRYIPMDRKHQGAHSTHEVLTPGIDFDAGTIEPDHHREGRTNNELVQLDLNYGLTPRWMLTISVPLINNRYHEHVVIHDPGVSEHFNRVDGASGLGDVRLGFKHAVLQGAKNTLIWGGAVKVPTGAYQLKNAHGEINEPTMMPGTGSWDVLATAYYSRRVMPNQFSLFVSGSYQFNTTNDLNYRFGNVLSLHGGVNYGLQPALLGSLQLNLRTAPRDHFHSDSVRATGGTWLYLTPGITLRASANTALYTHLQLPIYQRVNESNLVPGYAFMLGLSYAFDASPE